MWLWINDYIYVYYCGLCQPNEGQSQLNHITSQCMNIQNFIYCMSFKYYFAKCNYRLSDQNPISMLYANQNISLCRHCTYLIENKCHPEHGYRTSISRVHTYPYTTLSIVVCTGYPTIRPLCLASPQMQIISRTSNWNAYNNNPAPWPAPGNNQNNYKYLQSIGIQGDLPRHLRQPSVGAVDRLPGTGAKPGAPHLAVESIVSTSDAATSATTTTVRFAMAMAGQPQQKQRRPR